MIRARTSRLVVAAALIAATFAACTPKARDAIQPAPGLPATTPWDLAALSTPPDLTWRPGSGPVRSLTYRGEPYQGHPTSVFAYYASPGTLAGDPSLDHDLPAVVLVHGGGGHAFREWATLWARRGYAAIAMDLAGCDADSTRLVDGGPGQEHADKFASIDAPVSDQWVYHAAANVILAHSLIRSFDGVDADRTALTGISWGGFLTCIVAGLDTRFSAAVPVYGCGFLTEGGPWVNDFAKMTTAQKERWVTLWDPSRYIGSAVMPMFFVNSTSDFFYPLDIYEKTYGLVRGERNFRITIAMPHGHEEGWAPEEIGLFIDACLGDAPRLPAVQTPLIAGAAVRADVIADTRLVSAELCYATGSGQINQRPWSSLAARVDGQTVIAPAPPADATLWLVTVTDERGAVVSSEVMFVE